MLGSVRCLNLGAARGYVVRVLSSWFCSACGRMLVIYGGASCVRDLGRVERPRADEEEQTAEDSCLASDAHCLGHTAPCTEGVALRPVWSALRAGTSTSSQTGMVAVVGVGRRLAVCVGSSVIYLQHGARRIGGLLR
jgi:hypothetical protein